MSQDRSGEESSGLRRAAPNFRMKRSRWDKVPFEAAAAGRLSWC
jgi:hypothetical protein